MRKLIMIIFFVLFLVQFGYTKEIYFYTETCRGGIIQSVKVKIYNGSQKLLDIKQSQWTRVDVGNVSSYNLEFKSGTYMSNKKLQINFSNKDVAFVKIALYDYSWTVNEKDYRDVPSTISNDYVVRTVGFPINVS